MGDSGKKLGRRNEISGNRSKNVLETGWIVCMNFSIGTHRAA